MDEIECDEITDKRNRFSRKDPREVQLRNSIENDRRYYEREYEKGAFCIHSNFFSEIYEYVFPTI